MTKRTRPSPFSLPDAAFIPMDSTVMLLNEMITNVNVQDSDRSKYTIRFKPHRFSLNWLQGDIIDIACDFVTVESEHGARYEITDISDKRLRLI